MPSEAKKIYLLNNIFLSNQSLWLPINLVEPTYNVIQGGNINKKKTQINVHK